MRSAAIFVDAGYLFSAGSDLVYGAVVKRHFLDLCEPEALIKRVMNAASERWDGEPLRLLRTYWYDGAVDGVPSPTQIAVGELPRVKLRLGRMSAGGQKGVDGLIILDLITLARNRAVDVAILLSGDEDLRETALHAQSFGLTVIVAGFPRSSRQGQSVSLLREADHVVSLTKVDVEPHIQLTPAGEAAGIGATPSAVSPTEDQSGDATISAPDPAEAEESLTTLYQGVVDDERFMNTHSILDMSGYSPRLTRQADKVLIARLAELTGVFPVDAELVRRSRAACVALVLSRNTMVTD